MSFANTVELQIREGCKSYDLYISSNFRRSLNISGLSEEDQVKYGKSILKILYEQDKEGYNKMIKSFQELAKKEKMIFLGISNDSALFIKSGEIILDITNKYLDSYEQNAQVSRIVLTEEIGEKSPPKCYPMRPGGIVGLNKSHYHKPNYKSTTESHSWEPQVAEYYIDNPDIWLLPRKQEKSISK
tara:strand:- start:36 stop:593 length:558 start_codon:yes stop_codon:yes gene_type:complete